MHRQLNYLLNKMVIYVDKIFEVITSILLFFVVFINGMEIFVHSVIGDSLHWVYEINLLCANWIYFLGICLVYIKKKDIVVDLIDRLMSENTKSFYSIILNIVIVIMLSIIAYQASKLMFIQVKTKTLGLGIPNFYFSMPVFISSIAIILILIRDSLDISFNNK